MMTEASADDNEPLLDPGGSAKLSPLVINGGGAEQKNGETQSRRSSKRLSRQSSMEQTVDDVLPPPKKKSCPDYFGVKSYLHHFYDAAFDKDPSIFEEECDQYLLNPYGRRRRCRPLWWKMFTWIGINLLVFGSVGILVGYLVTEKPIVVRTDPATGIVSIDKAAISRKNLLDLCKLIGLVLFCVGGTTLALSLLFPSFLASYCEDDRFESGVIRVRYGDEEKQVQSHSPIEMTIPSQTQVKNVQPERKQPECTQTQEGLVRFAE